METNKPKNDESTHFDPRWQVQAFAEAMEGVLQDNDDKGGWDNCPIEYLETRLLEEIEEWKQSKKSSFFDGTSELIDIANFAMMIWDRRGS